MTYSHQRRLLRLSCAAYCLSTPPAYWESTSRTAAGLIANQHRPLL